MSKSIQYITIALIVSVAICTASPARLEKLKPSKSKFLSRQEVAEDIPAQTPYPPAGIKPEVAFNLPTEQQKLETPDNTYLPPVGAVESSEASDGVAQLAQTYGPPAQTYGPPALTYEVPKMSVKDEVEKIATEQPATTEEQPDESHSAEGISEVVSVSEEQSEDAKPSEEDEQENNIAEDDDAENEAELEAEEIEAEINRVETEEGLINRLSERIVSSKNAKIQVASPLALQPILPQPIYLVNYNGQLYRLLN